MRFPALWMVAFLAAGILLGRGGGIHPLYFAGSFFVLLLSGLSLLKKNKLMTAWAVALCGWAALGAMAASLELRSVPLENVAALVDAGALDTSESLRWRGRLRNDPMRLPWGARYEIDLESVEVKGAPRAVSGGLRLNYFFVEARPEALPVLRAGDEVEALVRARRPRNFLNPGAFDTRTHYARQGVHLVGSLRSVELLRKTGDPPLTIGQRLARVRGALLARLDGLYSGNPSTAAVLRAMLLGDFSFLDREVSENFQKTAVYHVLVISGMHVAALAVFVWWVARRLHLPMEATVVLVLIVLLAFVSIVEDRPPVARAAWMAAVTLAAQLLYRRVSPVNTISVAAGILIVMQPSALLDPSFQLSFLAAGLIAGVALPIVDRTSAPYRHALKHMSDVTRDAAHPPRAAQFRMDMRTLSAWLMERLPTRERPQAARILATPCSAALWTFDLFLISLTVQFGMLPLMAHYFHRVSLSGAWANLPAGVLSGLIVPFGFLALAADFISRWAGVILAKFTGWVVALLLGSVNAAAEWSAGAFRIPGPPQWALLLFYAALAAVGLALLAQKKKFWLWVPLAAAVLVAVVCAVHPFPPKQENGAVEVTLLDVGQGDSIFAAFPGGRTLLMDGGGSYGAARVGGVRTGLDIGEQVVSPYLWQRGIKRLDAIALSHAHNDHLDGLNAVLENFSVGELWYGREVKTPTFLALLNRARVRGTKLRQLRRGDRFEWDGVHVSVMWPEAVEPAETAKNDDSLVLRLEYGNETFLLTGDVERPVEEALVASGAPLDADFLKVAHHASRTSSTAEFLAASTPRVAAASFGEDNPFGYPHREAVARLCAIGAKFYRTDHDGAISVRSTGQGLQVRSYAEEMGLSRRAPDPCVAGATQEVNESTIAKPDEPKRPVGAKAKSKRSPASKRPRKPRTTKKAS